MKQLSGKVAVVTGGAGGIGYALARRFVDNGMSVVLADVEEEALADAVEELRIGGGRAAGVATDVADPKAVERLAEETLSTFGAAHVVCNNAGVDSGAPFSEIPLDAWRWVLGVNVWGVIHGCRTFLPLLREQGEGHIVNTASIAALAAALPTGTPYVTSKFAVLGLSENLHHELSITDPDIGVSVLCPSFVRTRMPESERNRPEGVETIDDHPGRQAIIDFAKSQMKTGLDPLGVADEVVEAIRTRRFFVLPHHDDALAAVQRRLTWMTDNVPPPSRPGRPTI